MSTQAGFLFEAPLSADPVSQLPTPAPRCENKEFVDRLRVVLDSVPDDIDIDAPLLAIGLSKESLTGWHRARSMDALIGGLFPVFQAYVASGEKLRYRRLPPLEACPGFGDSVCGKPTRGGIRCPHHACMEAEDLWNQE